MAPSEPSSKKEEEELELGPSNRDGTSPLPFSCGLLWPLLHWALELLLALDLFFALGLPLSCAWTLPCGLDLEPWTLPCGAPNYYPNSFTGPEEQPALKQSCVFISGDVQRFNSSVEDNVSQVQDFFVKVLNEEERTRLCENIANHLKDAQLFIQKRAVKNFTDVHPDYGAGIQAYLDRHNAEGKRKD